MDLSVDYPFGNLLPMCVEKPKLWRYTMFLLPLMSASLTVYTYSSETPLKQVDINLPCFMV